MRKNAPPGRNWIAPFCGGDFHFTKQKERRCTVTGGLWRFSCNEYDERNNGKIFSAYFRGDGKEEPELRAVFRTVWSRKKHCGRYYQWEERRCEVINRSEHLCQFRHTD